MRISLPWGKERTLVPPSDASEPTGGRPDAELVSDRFCTESPIPANAIEIFAGEWSSRLPAPYEELTGSEIALFDDQRIHWGSEHFGGFDGMSVLELGPLEGGHTYMLDRMGAREVLAIEANQKAFLRCLIVKEVFGIPSARFLCGDFVKYLEQAATSGADRWDLCVASGVLYHQQDPVALLQLVSKVCDRVLLWTHFYDATVITARPDLAPKFPSSVTARTSGFSHTLHRYEYASALAWGGFCGGPATWSCWMERDEILSCLEHLGFADVEVAFEQLDHQNGPAFCVAARRR